MRIRAVAVQRRRVRAETSVLRKVDGQSIDVSPLSTSCRPFWQIGIWSSLVVGAAVVGAGAGLLGGVVVGDGLAGAGVGLVWKASVASSAMLRSRAYTRASRSAPQRWLQVPAAQDVQPSVASVYFHSARKNWGRKCEQNRA